MPGERVDGGDVRVWSVADAQRPEGGTDDASAVQGMSQEGGAAMSGPRGKRRAVAEILSQERTGEGVRFYRFTARLVCGHVVKISAANRYKRAEVPVLGYCMTCLAMDGVVA